MILETEEEKDAFEFVCKLADMATDRICNDLEEEDMKKFGHLKVPTDILGKTIMKKVVFDFDVLHWLKKRIK